ncbi:50S ribosomal protein L31 [Brachybacterium fresconis]|uniref:Large subunit ribosomal protein L31 n=1 Tax=Brachybacterium fresconis TaxID=173363 RepID=A0ABS4YMS1_9MICO|nr:50S ribosomal protein L31 [Brachybacterium fresconis]MBP2410094.1 large subunit ribosomal protein L31 [Brachybacterium fresconis]
MKTMTHAKKTTHPETRTVVFRDQSADLRYLTRSTRTSEHTTTWKDGNIYPVIDVDLSSAAHLSRARGGEGSARRRKAAPAGRR